MQQSTQIPIENIGAPQYAHRLFIQMAIAEGIEPIIESLVPRAVDEITLLIQLKTALWESNSELSRALNIPTLRKLIQALNLKGSNVVPADDLPLPAKQAAPATTTVTRGVGDASVLTVIFPDPPTNWGYGIVIDNVLVREVDVPAAGESSGGFCTVTLTGIAPDGKGHSVLVAYRKRQTANAPEEYTRFGPRVKI